MCLGPEIDPPTEKGRFYKQGLRILIIVHCVIVLLNFIAAKEFLQQAIFGLFFIFILFMIQHQCSYQILMFFIFIAIFFAISFLSFFLTPIQNQKYPSSLQSFDRFVYAVSIISFVYYVFAMIYCFFPYREFKAIAYNENPALRNFFGGDGDEANNPPNNKPEENAYNVDYQPNYGNIDYDRNKRNNDNGTFQVFKGQGVRIG